MYTSYSNVRISLERNFTFSTAKLNFRTFEKKDDIKKYTCIAWEKQDGKAIKDYLTNNLKKG